MKKVLSYILIAFIGIILFPGKVISQVFNATAYYGSSPTSIIIVLKPDFNFNDKLGEIGFAIQVPKMANGTPVAMPTITVLNNFLPTTFISNYPQIAETSDPNFYNFKFGATALPTAPVLTVASGTELQVVELLISAPAEAVILTRLAHLAGGGPGTQYGVAFIDGSQIDRTDYAQMFYGPGLVPSVPALDQSLGYDTYQYVLASDPPLPVRFRDFGVVKKDNNALLNWQVENETSITDRYEIERSLNGINFKKVYTVLPKNNGLTANSYDLTDFDLTSIRSVGIIYYRITQYDKDGKYISTSIKSLRLQGKELAIAVFPNPVKGYANVTIDLANAADVLLTINDAAGKQVQALQMQLFKGANIKKINMGSLAAGSYIMKIQAGTEVKTIPLVKAN